VLLAHEAGDAGELGAVGLVSRGSMWRGSSWDGLVSDRQGKDGQSPARVAKPFVSDGNSIPTLHMGASSRRGKALRQQLRVLIKRLKGSKAQGASKTRGRRRMADRRGGSLAGGYEDPYQNPYHAEKYDQAKEQSKWDALARKFREEHPNLDPQTEQKELDALW
jgi:hypothetical protein